jgi:hypothetical protein
MRQEVKANELAMGRGPWAALRLGDDVRKRGVYPGFMRFQAKAGSIRARTENVWGTTGARRSVALCPTTDRNNLFAGNETMRPA